MKMSAVCDSPWKPGWQLNPAWANPFCRSPWQCRQRNPAVWPPVDTECDKQAIQGLLIILYCSEGGQMTKSILTSLKTCKSATQTTTLTRWSSLCADRLRESVDWTSEERGETQRQNKDHVTCVKQKLFLVNQPLNTCYEHVQKINTSDKKTVLIYKQWAKSKFYTGIWSSK